MCLCIYVRVHVHACDYTCVRMYVCACVGAYVWISPILTVTNRFVFYHLCGVEVFHHDSPAFSVSGHLYHDSRLCVRYHL